MNAYIDESRSDWEDKVREAIDALSKQGAGSFVAAEAFSVDDPANENRAFDICTQKQVLRRRPRRFQAVRLEDQDANGGDQRFHYAADAESALMTERSIQEAHIESQLMIMRCDAAS